MLVLVLLAFFKVAHGSFGELLALMKQAVPPFLAAKDPAVVAAVTSLAPDEALATARTMMPAASSVMSLGVKTSSTLAQLSTVVALVFGTAGLPHILIMFYTVPSAKAAKKSVTLCIVALGIFYLAAILLGFLLIPALYPQLVAWLSQGAKGVGLAKNMAVLDMCFKMGGPWLMAIGAAGAVAAILSTAAGLMITVASTISHDLYKVYINRQATEKQELAIAKITTLVMSGIAVILAVLLKQENVAWLVTLAFGIAASAIFPAMMATLWWKRATRQGLMAGMITGLVVSVLFIVLLLTGVKSFLGLPTSGGPGIFGVTASVVVLIAVSLMTRDCGKDVAGFFGLAHRTEKD
jgi:cation/acetate symporter